MSVARLYLDADSMERAVLFGLRARGIDATSAQEAGMADSSDEEQLEFSRTQTDACRSVSTCPIFNEFTPSTCLREDRTRASSSPPSSDTPLESEYDDYRN